MLSQESCMRCKDLSLLSEEALKLMLNDLPEWKVAKDGKALERTYSFKNFREALALVNRIGEVAEAENHHPDLKLGWGYVEVLLTTHKLGGITRNDGILASKIETLKR